MPRYAFKLRLKADVIEEYELAHQHVWPELLAKIKEAGISKYSIFRRGQELLSLCTWRILMERGINWPNRP